MAADVDFYALVSSQACSGQAGQDASCERHQESVIIEQDRVDRAVPLYYTLRHRSRLSLSIVKVASYWLAELERSRRPTMVLSLYPGPGLFFMRLSLQYLVNRIPLKILCSVPLKSRACSRNRIVLSILRATKCDEGESRKLDRRMSLT